MAQNRQNQQQQVDSDVRNINEIDKPGTLQKLTLQNFFKVKPVIPLQNVTFMAFFMNS